MNLSQKETNFGGFIQSAQAVPLNLKKEGYDLVWALDVYNEVTRQMNLIESGLWSYPDRANDFMDYYSFMAYARDQLYTIINYCNYHIYTDGTGEILKQLEQAYINIVNNWNHERNGEGIGAYLFDNVAELPYVYSTGEYVFYDFDRLNTLLLCKSGDRDYTLLPVIDTNEQIAQIITFTDIIKANGILTQVNSQLSEINSNSNWNRNGNAEKQYFNYLQFQQGILTTFLTRTEKGVLAIDEIVYWHSRVDYIVNEGKKVYGDAKNYFYAGAKRLEDTIASYDKPEWSQTVQIFVTGTYSEFNTVAQQKGISKSLIVNPIKNATDGTLSFPAATDYGRLHQEMLIESRNILGEYNRQLKYIDNNLPLKQKLDAGLLSNADLRYYSFLKEQQNKLSTFMNNVESGNYVTQSSFSTASNSFTIGNRNAWSSIKGSYNTTEFSTEMGQLFKLMTEAQNAYTISYKYDHSSVNLRKPAIEWIFTYKEQAVPSNYSPIMWCDEWFNLYFSNIQQQLDTLAQQYNIQPDKSLGSTPWTVWGSTGSGPYLQDYANYLAKNYIKINNYNQLKKTGNVTAQQLEDARIILINDIWNLRATTTSNNILNGIANSQYTGLNSKVKALNFNWSTGESKSTIMLEHRNLVQLNEKEVYKALELEPEFDYMGDFITRHQSLTSLALNKGQLLAEWYYQFQLDSQKDEIATRNTPSSFSSMTIDQIIQVAKNIFENPTLKTGRLSFDTDGTVIYTDPNGLRISFDNGKTFSLPEITYHQKSGWIDWNGIDKNFASSGYTPKYRLSDVLYYTPEKDNTLVKLHGYTYFNLFSHSELGPGFYAASANTRTIDFTLRHPEIAAQIGSYISGSLNISTNAVRFSTRIGLNKDIDFLGKTYNEGSQINAFRHVLWQATIANNFGEDIAKEVGDAHEDNPFVNLTQRTFSGLSPEVISNVDQSIDLLNNVIGRSIARNNPNAGMQELALKVLDYYYHNGLYTAEVNSDINNLSINIVQTKITTEQFNFARSIINNLNNYGETPQDVERRNAGVKEFIDNINDIPKY